MEYKSKSSQRLKSRREKDYPLNFLEEEGEWLKLTPGERLKETSKLWQFYISMGGSLDPEPDPQSPFYFQEI